MIHHPPQKAKATIVAHYSPMMVKFDNFRDFDSFNLMVCCKPSCYSNCAFVVYLLQVLHFTFAHPEYLIISDDGFFTPSPSIFARALLMNGRDVGGLTIIIYERPAFWRNLRGCERSLGTSITPMVYCLQIGLRGSCTRSHPNCNIRK